MPHFLYASIHQWTFGLLPPAFVLLNKYLLSTYYGGGVPCQLLPQPAPPFPCMFIKFLPHARPWAEVCIHVILHDFIYSYQQPYKVDATMISSEEKDTQRDEVTCPRS